MATDFDIELPLYNAFIELMRLEKNQPNKGIDSESYLELLDILHKGYVLNSKEELVFFCKKLWLKPFHTGNSPITEQVLETILLDNLRAYETKAEKEVAKQTNNQPDKTAKTGDVKNTNNNEEGGNEKQEDDINKEQEKPPEKETLTPAPTSVPLVINIEESDADNSFDQQDYSHFFNDKKFKFNFTYLAVSPRFIEQTIRSLRYKVKGTGKPTIDIEATVKDTASKGYFDNWLLREEEDFVTRWTLLFDRGGSMIAFHGLQDALADAAFKGTIKNDGDLFFFRNIAREFLYTNIQRTRSVAFEDLVNGPLRNILIVSDAGAARGSFNEDRIQHTYTMIYNLRKHHVAWLNPLPKERWKSSSASIISEFVNMFEPGNDYSDDLGNIVRLFKSKIVTPIIL